MNGSTPAANNPGTTERNSSTARALVPRSPARAVLEARPSTRSTSAYPLSFFARADAMDDVKNGQVDGILCWHNDRLHRQQRELEDFIELVDQSAIPVQTGHRRHLQFVGRERQDDRSYPCAVARQESEHKAERQRAKHDELAAQGSPSGGTRPFGLTVVKHGPDGRSYREEVPEEADAIREAARDIIAGTLVREICHTMRADIVIAAEPPVSLRAGRPEGSAMTSTLSAAALLLAVAAGWWPARPATN